MSALSRILKTLATPSVGTPYVRGIIFIAHAVVGAAIDYVMGGHGWVFAVALGVAYFAFKEAADMRKGGDLIDSLQDTIGLVMGASGVPWWPVAVLLTGFGVMVLAEMRR